jgi:hypothetical protein
MLARGATDVTLASVGSPELQRVGTHDRHGGVLATDVPGITIPASVA